MEAAVAKLAVKANLLLRFRSLMGYPADIATNQKKFSLLTVLLNAGGEMSNPNENSDIGLAYKASRYKIKLDRNDLEVKYDRRKINEEGRNIIELMAIDHDHDIFQYT